MNPPWDSDLMKAEIFGPILPIFEYSDAFDIIEKIKKLPPGLTMYYYGDVNQPIYKKMLHETESGSLVANDQGLSFISFSTGFGGVGFSG